MIYYKVKKCVNRKLEIRYDKNDPKRKYSSLIGKIQYYGVRKGRIFGFWCHLVGQENCDYMGNAFLTREYFEYENDCREFIKNFHYWKYGIEIPYKIID